MGYGGSHKDAAKQLGRTGDGGVDGVIDEDRLGLDRVLCAGEAISSRRRGWSSRCARIYWQPRWAWQQREYFVTPSGFSRQATDFVRHLPQRVILVDGPTLADLMIEHQVGIRISQTIEFKRLDEDFFTEEQ
jgi:restriction system protein